MAYYGSGYNSAGSVFGGYAGGYNRTPEGFFIPPNTNLVGVAFPTVLGSGLPSVNPTNYSGVVHFSPSSAVIGPQPGSLLATPGFAGPNLAMIGAPVFPSGF